MKKILVFLCLSAALLIASAEASGQNIMTATRTTYSDADTGTYTLKVVGSYNAITIQIFGTKNSGTPAGTAVLKGSLDGTNFVNLDSTNGLPQSNGSYTITNTTGTQTHAWTLDNARYVWYRVEIITSGTQNSSWSAQLLNRR